MDGAFLSGCRDQRVTLMEVVLDGCSLTFGQGACTASGEPCYNTWKTCRAPCAFDCETKNFWFTTCVVPPHLLQSYTPNISAVQSNPTKLEIGKSISTRGRIKVTMTDGAHTDQGFDPYWPRGAVPIRCAEDMPGTLLARWIERVKFFENRRVNVYNGYCDQALCEFTRESYFIDSVEGPDAAGKVVFTLKDPLILAEDKTAQCPRADDKIVATRVIGSEFPLPMRLGTELDGPADPEDDSIRPFGEVGSYLLENNYLAGDPKQDRCFARLRHICIGGEVLKVRAEINTATPSGWNIVLEDRAACGSTLSSHELGSAVSMAETFQNEHVADVLLRMLLECSDIEDVALSCCTDQELSLIDYDSFRAARCAAPLSFVTEAIVCKPTGLTKLMDELSEQFLFFLYPDSSTGKITMKVLAPPDCDSEVPTIDACQIINFSTRDTGERHNQITYLHDVIDCSRGISEDNFASSTVTVSSDALREACSRREGKTRNNRKMLSRWINSSNSYIARANGERWLMLRSCAAKEVKIVVEAQVAAGLELAGHARIHHPRLQGVDGLPLDDFWMLKGNAPDQGCNTLTFERLNLGRVAPCFNCDSSCPTNLLEVDECAPEDCVGIW